MKRKTFIYILWVIGSILCGYATYLEKNWMITALFLIGTLVWLISVFYMIVLIPAQHRVIDTDQQFSINDFGGK